MWKCQNFRCWCLLCSYFSGFYKIFILDSFLYKTFFLAMSCLDVLTSLFDMNVFLMWFFYQGFFRYAKSSCNAYRIHSSEAIYVIF